MRVRSALSEQPRRLLQVHAQLDALFDLTIGTTSWDSTASPGRHRRNRR